jgi:hypothetical protein
VLFRSPGDLRIFGISYYPSDPDGFNLYLFTRSDAQGSELGVNKFNTENGQFQMVANLDDGGGDRPRGMHITNDYDTYNWVMAGLVGQLAGDLTDRIIVWQVDALKDWMQVEPQAGRIAAGETQEFTLTLDAGGFPEMTFEGELLFLHDGVGGQTSIPVTLEILFGGAPAERTIGLNAGWNLVSVNLQPDEEDVRILTAPLVEAGLLELMKDSDGNFYYPARDYNRIPGWFSDQGYMMKLLRSADLTLVVQAIEAARKTGGNLTEVFEKISATIRERMRIEGRIRTLTAQGRLQGIIVSIMPLIIGVALMIVDPEMTRPFIQSPAGFFVMVAVGVLIGLGALVIRKIVNIDV